MSQLSGPGATISAPAFPSCRESLAVFDLDGTLVRTDSFLPYLITYARRGAGSGRSL